MVGYSDQLCIAAICDNTHNMNACRHMQQRLGHIQADHVYVCVAWFKQDKTVFKKKKIKYVYSGSWQTAKEIRGCIHEVSN